MRCPNCGCKVHKEWRFCPNCGYEFEKRDMFDIFGFKDIFSKIEKELRDMSSFDKDFGFFDLTPVKKSNIKGFSIRITSDGKRRPKVDIKTFGDMDKENIRNKIFNRLGIKERKGISEVKGVMEEPEHTVKRTGDKIVFEIKIPGVKNMENVEINDLENSVEIKALANEKTYFKILKKPTDMILNNYYLRDEVLVLEFS